MRCVRRGGTCARSPPGSRPSWSSRTPTTYSPDRHAPRQPFRRSLPSSSILPRTSREGARVTDAMPTTRLIRVDAPVEGHEGVALVTIDRPDALNALSFALLAELADALQTLDTDGRTRAMIITGAGERAFAAGADIVELADQTPERLRAEGLFDTWDRIGAIGIPLIAAVRGF